MWHGDSVDPPCMWQQFVWQGRQKGQLCDREWSWQRFDLFWKWVGSLNLDTLELTVLWAAAITVAQGARVEGQTETMSDLGF